jgi:hypothetical protein
LNPATDDPVPDSPDSRPRLGDLLLSSGLITQEQLDESLTLARTAEKPLGHVLVERGLVPAHSIAMALADQHGGPLKTEFGFATGRGSVPRPAALPDQARSGAPPVLRLASAPLPEEPAQSAAEEAARLGAEAQATELRARVEELESDLAAERAGRAAEAAALAGNELALAAAREELAAALDDAQSLHATLSGERESQQEVTAVAEALRARVTELEAAARRAETRVVALDTVDELRAVIELQEQALATASARELASTHRYSPGTHFLFAPSADGYDLLERSGPSPTPGEVVELSGGRTCRVLRVGPPPFPGAPEACAYLELV